MKLIRILPKILAKEWQGYDLAHVDSEEYVHEQKFGMQSWKLRRIKQND